MVSVAPITATAQKISSLKTTISMSALYGDYKGYKNAKKELANLAVKNFETYKNTHGIQIQGSVPMFTKTFWKVLKVMILDKFRKKTADEKELAKMNKIEILKQQFHEAIRQRVEQHLKGDIDTVYKDKTTALTKEMTDKALKIISKDFIDTLSEEAAKKGSYNESLVNAAVKELPKWVLDAYKSDLHDAIYNRKFLNNIKKGK